MAHFAGSLVSPRRVGTAAFALTSLLVFSASAAEYSAKSSDAAGRTRIRIATAAPSLSYLPIHVARERGFYARRGFDLEMIQMSAGLAVPVLLSGSVDYTTILSGPATASARGAPLKTYETVKDTYSINGLPSDEQVTAYLTMLANTAEIKKPIATSVIYDFSPTETAIKELAARR